ncbi:MAG: neutral zinc metallopeptidase [Geodermatophilaceae bacterium]
MTVTRLLAPRALPMRRTRRSRPSGVVLLGCSLLLLAVGGCTTLVAGTPTSALSQVTPAQLCPGTGSEREDAATLVTCISSQVSDYWTSVLGEPVQAPRGVDPDPAAVPYECRTFLAFGTAFYCPPDATVYITGALLDLYAAELGDGLPYGLAFLLGHEFGHVAQHVVGQPELSIPEPTYTDLRGLEQQADCLAGVWVGAAAEAAKVNPALFRVVAEQELTIISGLEPPPGVGLDDYDEVATHGSVEERLAAFDTGVAGGTGSACGLIGVN